MIRHTAAVPAPGSAPGLAPESAPGSAHTLPGAGVLPGVGALPGVPIYLYRGVADMRKSFDGLTGLILQANLADPLNGAWYVFRNRRGDRLKILYFDHDGMAIWYKRLEAGRFQWPAMSSTADSMRIDMRQLRLILDGIDLASVRHRRRWKRKAQKSCG